MEVPGTCFDLLIYFLIVRLQSVSLNESVASPESYLSHHSDLSGWGAFCKCSKITWHVFARA